MKGRGYYCGGDDTTPYPHHFWHLDGQAWTKVGGAPVDAIEGPFATRDLPGDATVVVRPGKTGTTARAGSVSYQSGGTGTTLYMSPCIDQIIGIRTPPAASL